MDLQQLYVRVGTLLTRGELLYVRIISLRREVWPLKSSIAPPLLLQCLF